MKRYFIVADFVSKNTLNEGGTTNFAITLEIRIGSSVAYP